jgi:hypothetical protein
MKIIVNGTTTSTTAHGERLQPNKQMHLQGICFPELATTRKITEPIVATIMDSPTAPYDVIVGRDVLDKYKLIVDFDAKFIRWSDLAAHMRRHDQLHCPVHLPSPLEPDDPAFNTFYTTVDGKIKPAKYEAVSIDNVIKQQDHLDQQQKEKLRQTLSGVTRLFSGKLGVYPHKKIHLDLKDGAESVHCKPFTVPCAHAEVFKQELERLQSIGVLDPVKVGATEHAYLSFIIPEKDGTVRWISDFRQLNKILRRKVFPLPNIHDTLTKRKGYKYFTKIDISMCYYTFELDEDSSWYCVTVTPSGNSAINVYQWELPVLQTSAKR